jgi:hypothetical protein
VVASRRQTQGAGPPVERGYVAFDFRFPHVSHLPQSLTYIVERIKLLVHLLRNLGQSHNITAEKLREAGQDVRRSISPPERLQILDEVYSVRHMEERYMTDDICKCRDITINQPSQY